MEKEQMIQPFPSSKKVYVKGSREDIQVPFREIALSPTVNDQGETPNEPIRVYDTSGAYTDESCEINIYEGLKKLRTSWIEERGDVER